MYARHLVKWYIRKEGSYVLYGYEKTGQTLVRVENPHIVMEPSGMAAVQTENEEFSLDVLDMDLKLFDAEGFECVPGYGLALVTGSAVPEYVNKVLSSDIFKFPGYTDYATATAPNLCTWYVKTEGKKNVFYGCPSEPGGEEIRLVNPIIVCNAMGKMVVVKGKKRYKCWIDDAMRPLCDETAWQQLPPYCISMSDWKKELLEKVEIRRRKGIGAAENLLEDGLFEGFLCENSGIMKGGAG